MRDVGIDVPGMAPSIDTTQLKGVTFVKMGAINNFSKYAQNHIKRR